MKYSLLKDRVPEAEGALRLAFHLLALPGSQGVEFVAALADTVLIAHAQPGSKTEQLAREVLGWGKQVYTLSHPTNEHLLALAAKVWGLSEKESREIQESLEELG